MLHSSEKALNNQLNVTKKDVRTLYVLGGSAAFAQLVLVVAYAIVLAALGPKPTTAVGYFQVQQDSILEVVLRGDLLLVVMIAMYLLTFPAIFVAMRKEARVLAGLATLCTVVAVTLSCANESTFSLLHLGNAYASATSETIRNQIVAAGEAVIATDMWNGTGAYMSGILLQGSGVLMSVLMFRSRSFTTVTAVSGLLGNGLDLVQHVAHPFTSTVTTYLSPVMGVIYVAWFVMLGRDLLRLARSKKPHGRDHSAVAQSDSK